MAKKRAKSGAAAKAKKSAPTSKKATRRKSSENKSPAKSSAKKASRVTKKSLDKEGSPTDGNFEELNVANYQEGDRVEFVSISQETRRRYLNYAMSVIQSRALPDVRDGLKPVQRRILYVMYHGLHLTHDAKTRKCAKICGDTTGNYHPHGDQ